MCLCAYSTGVQWDCCCTFSTSISRWPVVQLFTLCELTHFRLIWYLALWKGNPVHMTYGTQANFNVWIQICSPESEAVDSPVPYRLYLFELYQHCHGKLSLWKDSVYMHIVSALCQIISAFISPASQISTAQTWHWWLQAIPLLAAYLSLKRRKESGLLASCTIKPLGTLETESEWVSVENRNLLMHFVVTSLHKVICQKAS